MITENELVEEMGGVEKLSLSTPLVTSSSEPEAAGTSQPLPVTVVSLYPLLKLATKRSIHYLFIIKCCPVSD